MTAKRWFIMLAAAVALAAALVCGFNALVDPFGVFGDRVLNWYAYNMTQNPKAAKAAYLKDRLGDYNAYVIGPSGSSSFSPQALDAYTGLRWYNTFNYGMNMDYTLKLATYLAENGAVEHFLLNLPYISAIDPGETADSATEWFHPDLAENGAVQWLRFLFANPRYAIAKIQDYRRDSYLQEPYDVFNPETGVYDKSKRDIEPIGSLDAYLLKYPEFTARGSNDKRLGSIDALMETVAEIKSLCDAHGITLTVVIPPVSESYASDYNREDEAAFRARLAAVTEFYDFGAYGGEDPRYFYDTGHFRNSLGNMILAEIFHDKTVYTLDGTERAHNLQVLLYHHIVEEGETAGATMTLADFGQEMAFLHENGYNTVNIADIISFVREGVPLPENAVLIRFDDGYLSNYELAYPVLQRYGFKAVIFTIGVSVGKDTYKETDAPIIPHFTFAQAKEMINSGLVEVHSHSYDMHQSAVLDGADCRQGVSQRPGESEADYVAAFIDDFTRSRMELEQNTGQTVTAFAYPEGRYNLHAQVMLGKLGIDVTMITERGVNTLVKGLPQSLCNLKIVSFDELAVQN